MAGDPFVFRDYVQQSGAEFSVAQGIYVETQSGWFSERSARYLAAGRPVVVQDTGFTKIIPTGEGILAFSTVDEAARGARAIARTRPFTAARTIAVEYFDSTRS